MLGSILLLGCIMGGDDDGSACEVATAGVVGSGVVYSVASVYEIVDAASSARAYNRRHGLDLAITPTATPANGGISRGLALSGRF